MPKVTVVIPTYNAAPYIAQTLDTALQQSLRDIEVIVVDDCSKDRTVEIVAEIMGRDARVKILKMPKNFGGPAGPRNAGVAAAQSPWIALLDADDLWHPRKLELQLNVLEQSGARMCCTSMVDFKDGTHPKLSDETSNSTTDITFPMQLRKSRIPTSSVLISKQLLDKFPFNEEKHYRAVEDHHCWLRCVEYSGSCKKILTPMLGYRISNTQISRGKWNQLLKNRRLLGEYRLTSGAPLGWRKEFYIVTHVVLGIYYRVILGKL